MIEKPEPLSSESSMAEIARSLATLAGLAARVAPALERIAAALEKGNFGVAAPEGAVSTPSPIELIRLAIRDRRWIEAEGLLVRLVDLEPESREAEGLRREVAEGKDAAIASGRARLEAARSVHDPSQIVEARDELALLLSASDRASMDREIVRGLMLILQKRLRAGKIGVEVAELAATMADRFAETTEGASLRAALPTLRRSAGLCPRCAKPYRGINDACPICLGRPETSEEDEIPGVET